MMKIQYHWHLDVYKLSVESSMEIFELTKLYPKEEIYSLTDQIRRSSRSVSGQISEGWRRRKYKAAFINKLNEAEGEAAETQVWLEYSVKCNYISREIGESLHLKYDNIIAKLVNMGNNSDKWVLKSDREKVRV
ncbi:MAG: four helix bundle protein [Bacteroidetes bacterium GWA2_30_7]|nr:MAG: four helix bundle protein [Bacteroidetes bacterium GWA2_30_7]